MTKFQFWLIMLIGCILGCVGSYLVNLFTWGKDDAKWMTLPYLIWYLVIFAVWSFLIYGTGGLFGVLK